MAKKLEIKDILIGGGLVFIVLYLFGGNFLSPTQAVEDVEGLACVENADCPCVDAGGIGVNNCNEGTCDTSFCFETQPVKDWWKGNAKGWIESHWMLTLGLVIGGIFLAWTFKR